VEKTAEGAAETVEDAAKAAAAEAGEALKKKPAKSG
jgi:hypothetical protein